MSKNQNYSKYLHLRDKQCFNSFLKQRYRENKKMERKY